MLVSLFWHFCIQKIFPFFVSLYKELLEPTWEIFSACLIVLNNLCEVFECSVITDFISTMFGFLKDFDCWVITFYCFTDFPFFFLINDWYCCLVLHWVALMSQTAPVGLSTNELWLLKSKMTLAYYYCIVKQCWWL